MMQKLYYDYLKTPIADFILVANHRALLFVGLKEKGFTEVYQFLKCCDELEFAPDQLRTYKLQLKNYVNGKQKTFDFPYEFIGTAFQQSVWSELMRLNYGDTISYRELAIHIASEKYTRAVATAVAKNPLLLVVPCHRVVRSDGNYGGFRAGILLKEKLISIEKTNNAT